MKLLSTLALGAIVVLTIGLSWIVYNNRASERIVGAVLPILIAATAGVGIVLAFSRPAPVTNTFPAMFFYRSSDFAPVSMPFRPVQQGLFLISQLYKLNSNALAAIKASKSERLLYHHLLQRAMVDWLAFKYRGSWQMDVMRMNLQGIATEVFQPKASAVPGTVIDTATLERALARNQFASVSQLAMSNQLTLPPGSTLIVDAPTTEEANGAIRIKNRFAELVIDTRFSMFMAGGGEYMALMGLDRFDTGMSRVMFTVKTTFTPNFWFSGHPEMANIRAWAQQMIEELRNQFDEELHWTKAQQAFLLARQLPPQQGSVTPGTIGLFPDATPPPAQDQTPAAPDQPPAATP
jgi:hypothetical protein